MISTKDLFHKLSYLQYPLMAIMVFYFMKPYFVGFDSIWENYNSALIFAGLGISFSTLQDTKKTQNKISKRIWESPKKGKIFLIYLSLITLFIIVLGVVGMYMAKDEKLSELSFGLIVFGIGLIGLTKSAIELFENHRKDKNVVVDNK